MRGREAAAPGQWAQTQQNTARRSARRAAPVAGHHEWRQRWTRIPSACQAARQPYFARASQPRRGSQLRILGWIVAVNSEFPIKGIRSEVRDSPYFIFSIFRSATPNRNIMTTEINLWIAEAMETEGG